MFRSREVQWKRGEVVIRPPYRSWNHRSEELTVLNSRSGQRTSVNQGGRGYSILGLLLIDLASKLNINLVNLPYFGGTKGLPLRSGEFLRSLLVAKMTFLNRQFHTLLASTLIRNRQS
jgi:hypothetical protein